MREMQDIVQLYQDSTNLHQDFEALHGACLDMAGRAQRLRELRFQHGVRASYLAVLEQQLSTERKAAAAARRAVAQGGLEAAEQYLTQSSLSAELQRDAQDLAFLRMQTSDFTGGSLTAAALKEAGYSAADLVDPVHRAFYSFLHHRKAAVSASAADEDRAELAVLDALMEETKLAIKETLPAGLEVQVNVLPPLQTVLEADAKQTTEQLLASLNADAFSRAKAQAAGEFVPPEIKVETKEVEVEVVTGLDGSRTLEAIAADAGDDAEEYVEVEEYEYVEVDDEDDAAAQK